MPILFSFFVFLHPKRKPTSHGVGNEWMHDRKDFDQLFRLYYEPLYRFALQFIADREECHDIVSGAYEDVWRSFERIEAATVKSYLYTNVRNKCIDLLRRQRCHSRYIGYVEHLSERYAHERYQTEHEETQRLIDSILGSMKSPTREILEACYLHEKKYKEVAAEMNISIATVKKHMVRALKMLRELKKTLNP